MNKDTSLISFSDEQKQRLRELGVSTVYLFGSRAQGTASPLSDFDFGILLEDQRSLEKTDQALYLSLYDLFSSLIVPESRDADIIDIVFLQSARVSLELKSHIIRHGMVVFDNDQRNRADFEMHTMLADADCAPLQREMSEALLARL